jgi:hypothetical protein
MNLGAALCWLPLKQQVEYFLQTKTNRFDFEPISAGDAALPSAFVEARINREISVDCHPCSSTLMTPPGELCGVFLPAYMKALPNVESGPHAGVPPGIVDATRDGKNQTLIAVCQCLRWSFFPGWACTRRSIRGLRQFLQGSVFNAGATKTRSGRDGRLRWIAITSW